MERVAHYLEAIEQINLAQKELDQIVETVAKAAEILPERWASVSVVASQERFVPEVPTGEKRHAISEAQWPSIAIISRCLSQLHEAYESAEAAWDAIEPEYRAQLVSPPKKFAGAEHHEALAGRSEA